MTEPPPEMTATIAHDDFAERTVLAACLNDPAMIGRARRSLSTDSFWRNHHGLIFAAMMDLDDRQQPTSPFAVYETLIAEKNLTRAGGANTLHDLYAFPYFGTNLAVATVGKLARQRSRSAVAMRFSQIAEEVEDPDAAAFAWAKAAVELESLIDDHDEAEPVEGLSTWEEFFARPPKPSDSVVPGLLDRVALQPVLARLVRLGHGGGGDDRRSEQGPRSSAVRVVDRASHAPRRRGRSSSVAVRVDVVGAVAVVWAGHLAHRW
jgi:hypothetical protein